MTSYVKILCFCCSCCQRMVHRAWVNSLISLQWLLLFVLCLVNTVVAYMWCGTYIVWPANGHVTMPSAKVQKACKALIRAACLVRTAIQVMII